jgi:hypothetical protein
MANKLGELYKYVIPSKLRKIKKRAIGENKKKISRWRISTQPCQYWIKENDHDVRDRACQTGQTGRTGVAFSAGDPHSMCRKMGRQ